MSATLCACIEPSRCAAGLAEGGQFGSQAVAFGLAGGSV